MFENTNNFYLQRGKPQLKKFKNHQKKYLKYSQTNKLY